MSTAINDPSGCPYCGMLHKAICPRIKSVKYSDMNPGTFERVEFFAPNEYPKIEMPSPDKQGGRS